jgi:hypothetical protein
MLQAIRCLCTSGDVYGRGCCPHLPCHYQPLTGELGGDLSRSPGVPCLRCHVQRRGCAPMAIRGDCQPTCIVCCSRVWGGLL